MDAAAVETVKEYAQWIYVKFTWKKMNGMVMTEDCILCTQCMQACPENNVLKLQFFNKNIFYFVPEDYFIKKFKKVVGVTPGHFT